MKRLIFEANTKRNVKITIAEVASDNITSRNPLKSYNFHYLEKFIKNL